MLNVQRELKNGLKLNKENINIEVYTEFYISEFKNVHTFEKIEVFSFLKLQFNELYYYAYIENRNNTYISTKKLFENDNVDIMNEKEKIFYLFNLFFKKYQNTISHYCRNFYQILKYIRENEKQETLGKEQKIYLKYSNILQSQLNNDEQFLLFYYFIVFNNQDDKELSTINICNHYKFLENLGYENLLDNEKHNNKNFYNFEIK